MKNELRRQGCGTSEDYIEYCRRNMSNVEVLRKMEAKRYLFSESERNYHHDSLRIVEFNIPINTESRWYRGKNRVNNLGVSDGYKLY